MIGEEMGTFKAAETLSPDAAALLQALVRAGGSEAPGKLRQIAETITGRPINVHALPFRGRELSDLGLVDLPKKRGSKTLPWVLRNEKQAKLIAESATQLGAGHHIPDGAFNRTFAEILEELEDAPKDKKGTGLETLAARICWKLGLSNIEVRKLSEYEIDVRAEGTKPLFQKWIIQCKATSSSLGPAPVLREYGIAKLENIPVIAFVTTSTISKRARTVTEQIMKWSNKVVLVIAKGELERLRQDEDALYAILSEQSEHAREVKVEQKTAGEAIETEEEGEED